MASTTTSVQTTQSRGSNTRARGGNRGRRGGRSGPKGEHRDPGQTSKPHPPPAASGETKQVGLNTSTEGEAAADDGDICWICAEPVKYWSVSECNHRTCHVCALRLRALYKKMECTFCKVRLVLFMSRGRALTALSLLSLSQEPQPSVIFTTSSDALWASYTPENVPYKDPKLAISFETQEMMEETLILLRFNCPDSECDFIGNGWSDLKLHTRATHGKLMWCVSLRSVHTRSFMDLQAHLQRSMHSIQKGFRSRARPLRPECAPSPSSVHGSWTPARPPQVTAGRGWYPSSVPVLPRMLFRG